MEKKLLFIKMLPLEIKSYIFSFDNGNWKYFTNTNSMVCIKKIMELKFRRPEHFTLIICTNNEFYIGI